MFQVNNDANISDSKKFLLSRSNGVAPNWYYSPISPLSFLKFGTPESTQYTTFAANYYQVFPSSCPILWPVDWRAVSFDPDRGISDCHLLRDGGYMALLVASCATLGSAI